MEANCRSCRIRSLSLFAEVILLRAIYNKVFAKRLCSFAITIDASIPIIFIVNCLKIWKKRGLSICLIFTKSMRIIYNRVHYEQIGSAPSLHRLSIKSIQSIKISMPCLDIGQRSVNWQNKDILLQEYCFATSHIIYCRHLYTNVVCRFEGKEFKSCNPISLLIVWRTKRRNKRMQSAYADSKHTPCARMCVFYCNVAWLFTMPRYFAHVEGKEI